MFNKCAYTYLFLIIIHMVTPPAASFCVIMLGINLPKHFERIYYILYNNRDIESLIITRLLHIVSLFNCSSYFDLSYIHYIFIQRDFLIFLYRCHMAHWETCI